jgi:hypothetical protein
VAALPAADPSPTVANLDPAEAAAPDTTSRKGVKAPRENGNDGKARSPKAAPADTAAPAVTADEPAAKVAAKPGGESVDDILDDMVLGTPKDAPKVEAAAAKPDKKALDRRDVSTAMGAIQEEARSCFGVEKVTGTVSVKFSVGPSGKISSAAATGTFAGTPTGTCVADAVKGAHFPPYDGSPTSFTFPFLLSE